MFQGPKLLSRQWNPILKQFLSLPKELATGTSPIRSILMLEQGM
jgi:hypothetical protein